MVFCNFNTNSILIDVLKVTILILIDGFLQYPVKMMFSEGDKMVTILILIDGFLQ